MDEHRNEQPDRASQPTTLLDRWCVRLSSVYGEGASALPAFLDLYDDDVSFQDPLQSLHGLTEYAEMNRRSLEKARAIEVDIEDRAQQGDVFFVAWTMRFSPKLGPSMLFSGISHLRARGGKIIAHRDCFDAVSGVVSAAPGLSGVYHFFTSKLV